jgi:ubiquinone/menaquinone biosynthesis C-methylase UbiE
MRVTYRSKNVKEYWAARWEDIPADTPMDNAQVYPLKYSEMTLRGKDGRILEAGCGAGRILRYYHDRGYQIVGMDYIDVAISKLKAIDPTLRAEIGNITALHYADQSFKYVLAFGLYHNLENDVDKALGETFRILEKGGAVCASFRADNIQTRMTDWLEERKSKKFDKAVNQNAFHKMNLSKDEFARLFIRAGFLIEFIGPVENMPFLYKFAAFRAVTHKRFDENKARSEGYQLSWLGRPLQGLLMRLMPDQFCNIYVLIARKP